MCADLSPREVHGCNIAANRGNIDSNSTVLYLLGQHALTIDDLGSYPPVCDDLSPRAIHKQCISILIELRGCNIPASRGSNDSNRTVLYCLLGQHALTIDDIGSYHTPTIAFRQHALTVNGLVAISPCVLICPPGQYITKQNCMALRSPQTGAIWTQIGPCCTVCRDNAL